MYNLSDQSVGKQAKLTVSNIHTHFQMYVVVWAWKWILQVVGGKGRIFKGKNGTD